MTYTTPELFGIKEFLTLSGGWQNPTDIFINQPLNKFFINNTFTSNRGIGANGIGWGGSYSAWGGYIQGEAPGLVLPSERVVHGDSRRRAPRPTMACSSPARNRRTEMAFSG